MPKLTSAARNKLPASDFADPKDRKFPIENKAHVEAAESYKRFASPEVKKRIMLAAHERFGDDKAHHEN